MTINAELLNINIQIQNKLILVRHIRYGTESFVEKHAIEKYSYQ